MDARRYVPAGRPSVTSAVRMPFCATSFKPLKNAKRVGSVGVVEVSDEICSTTTCEWPWMLPAVLTCWGAEK